MSAWSEKHWLKPELFNQPELLQVKLRLTIVDNNANKSDNINGEKTTEKILKSIQSNPYITHRDLADLLGVSEDGVFYNIKKLKQQCLLRRVGPDKGGYWAIVNK